MKIKNQSGTGRSDSPSSANNSANRSSIILNSTHNQGSHSQFLTPSTSTQIWTRSAVRAAQQQKINDSFFCNRHSKNHGHTHILGKIVKPIPVRPMSSSSSSSTHSSQFNTKHMHSNISNLEKSINHDTISNNSLNSGLHNFSLIAKYFASFPATRLAKTSQAFSVNHNTNNPSSPVKSTPFLPFKKMTNNGTTDEQVHSSIVLRSQTATNLTNTDNLCTNFRRVIKLNDSEIGTSSFDNLRNITSPATQTPNSSEHSQSYSINLNSSQIFQAASEMNEHNLFKLPLNQDSTNSCLSNQNDPVCFMTCNDEDATTRLGQITMETRSTRKFLIKHHPYLQQANQPTNNINNLNLKSCNQRPSINLLKKLSSKKLDESVNNVDCTTNTTNSSSNNRSGRSSRSNNSGFNEQHDYNLLKFTDTAPTFSSNSKQLQKSGSFFQSTVKRRQHNKNLTTASALSTELNHSYKKQQIRSRTNKNLKKHIPGTNKYTYNSLDLCDCDSYGLSENSNQNLDKNSFEQYNDEQEEDSSGYYSSYHSVDLISSSGGSCVGAHNIAKMKPKQSNIKLKTFIYLFKS